MVHIAILDVDVPVPTVYSARGLYSSIFRHLLLSAASRRNLPPSTIYTTAFDVVGGSLPPLSALRTSPPHSSANGSSLNRDGDAAAEASNPLAHPIDGILITGSAAAAYESAKYPWIPPLQAFLQTVFNEYPHVKIFGACFGHQILAQALLSASESKPQTSISTSIPPTVMVEKCPRGREMGLVGVLLDADFRARFHSVLHPALPDKDRMRLQMVHGDWVVLRPGVERLPAPWMNVGSTEMCPVQGLYYPGRVLTFQGHFEFDVFMSLETCLEFARRGGWEREEVERSLELIGKGRVEGQAEDDDDSRVAAEVVLEFFRGG
ncbi:class I glutamine amidotransferase-like protein [Aspergillus egyptiacus]|nr:class I glutamine amidotransferase-like protein [Aspergillus egyptiacus]